MDDPLTAGPTRDSPLVGRAQGVYIGASQSTFGLLMAMNFVFVGGEYNGSSLAIMGRNEVPLKVRELPVVGGTGVFRLAKGYALLKTYLFHVEAGIAVVEYNVYVWH
ncbi:Dirigent protein 21 [Linum perenne]